MSLLKNAKKSIKTCNLACITMMIIVIALQFIPLWYNVGGTLLTQYGYDLLKSGEILVPGWSNVVDDNVELVSIASRVWWNLILPEGMIIPHLLAFVCGILGIIFGIKNLKSTLCGVLSLLCAIGGIIEAIQCNMLWYILGIMSMLIVPFALILCAFHVWKIITWFTVDEDRYFDYWK